jgi:uncharacterized repeat protein (TIGR01451 family)
VRDVFVHDRQSRTTERISRNSAGVQGNSGSAISTGGARAAPPPALSGDGRLVVFVSWADNLVSEDTNFRPDVFLHDRQSVTTIRVSVDNLGDAGITGGDFPAISANGRFVAFSGGFSGEGGVFVRDLQTATTEPIEVSTTSSDQPALSADGRFVTFNTGAALVLDDTNEQMDVYVFDRQTRTFDRVSVSSSGMQGDDYSGPADRSPAISANGRFVAFASWATNLVSGDTNTFLDVFVRDRQARTTDRVSVDSAGAQGNGASFRPAISDDGRFVAFESNATNLVPGVTGAYQIYLHDRQGTPPPPPPDLALSKSHMGDFTVGINGVYTLTVTNDGTGATTGTITVTDTLPAGLTFVSGAGAGWACAAMGQSVTCTNPGPLAPAARSTITLTVGVDAVAVPGVTNTARVATPGDANPANDQAGDPTTVRPAGGPRTCPPDINYGETIRCSIDVAGEVDSYRIVGAAPGQRVRVRLVETSGTLYAAVRVLRDGSPISGCPLTAADEHTCLLAGTGNPTYTIVVRDAQQQPRTGGYSLYVQRFPNPPGCAALTLGATVSASIGTAAGEVAGEPDCYTLTGTTGDRIWVRVIETAGTLYAEQEVIGPDGTTPTGCGRTAADERTCLLTAPGTHTILVRDAQAGTRTGSYSLTVQRFPTPQRCTALSFGANGTGSIGTAAGELAGEADCYTVTAASGERLRVRVIETGGTLYADQEVIGPAGATPTGCGRSAADERTCLLNATGTQTIVIRDAQAGTRTGAYTLYVQRFPNPEQCAAHTFGATATASIMAPAGAVYCHTVIAAAGERIRVRVIETGGTLYAEQEVIGPDGTTPTGCGRTAADERTCLLTAPGTHTILVRDAQAGTRTGGYSLYVQRFRNPQGCTPIAVGETRSGAIGDPSGEAECFTFAGVAGGTVQITVTETAGALYAEQEVIGPDGTTTAGCGRTAAATRTCSLTASGTHTILLRDAQAGTRTGAYTVRLTCNTQTC